MRRSHRCRSERALARSFDYSCEFGIEPELAGDRTTVSGASASEVGPILVIVATSLDDYFQNSKKYATPECRARREIFERAYAIAMQVIALRRERGLSQKQLAALSGIARSEISRIERGSIYPAELTLIKLADALNADVRLVERAPA